MSQQRSQRVEDAIAPVFWCAGIGIELAPWEVLVIEHSEEKSNLDPAKELERIKRGDFTPEELQNFCHNLDEKDAVKFREGCEVYCGKLFGGKQVFLTYFKKSGKYYTDGNYKTEQTSLHLIWSEVAKMQTDGKLPGLCEGGGKDFDILIEVPGHPHEHPHIHRAIEND